MPLTPNEQPITSQLLSAIKDMRDFLLANPSNENYYKILYEKIEKLNILAKTEGWIGYEHKNPHKTLRELLEKNNVSELVIDYYSIPLPLSRKLINPSTGKKFKKSFEWIFDQLKKVKPDIKL